MHAPHSARTRAFRLLTAVFAAGLVMAVAPLPTPSFIAVASASAAPLEDFSPLDAREVESLRSAAEGPVGAERVSAAATDVEGFSLVGVSLADVPDEPVMVRVRDRDGGWGEWNELEVDRDAGPEQGSAEDAASSGRVVSEPVWVGEGTGYEVSVADGDRAGGVEVTVVRERTKRVLAESTPLAGAAVPAPFGINSRASWGARAPSNAPSYASGGVRFAVVHHTAGSNNYTAAQVPGILRSIQTYHMDTNRWSDIAYNFLVDKYGGIWEGRAGGTGSAVIGAHARGFNTGSVGVSVLGNYQGVSSTAAAREAVSRIVGYRLHMYGVNPTARVNITSLGSTTIPEGRVVNLPTVIGHRDVGQTACPGSIYSHLGSIRNRALDWYQEMEKRTSPAGAISAVKQSGSRVDVIGWARDPDVAAAARVHVVLAGRLNEVFANGYRPDVEQVYPGYGENRGWSTSFVNLDEGTHRLCVTVINQGLGSDKLLGCRDVVVK